MNIIERNPINPLHLFPGDTLNVSANEQVLISHTFTSPMIVNEVAIFEDVLEDRRVIGGFFMEAGK